MLSMVTPDSGGCLLRRTRLKLGAQEGALFRNGMQGFRRPERTSCSDKFRGESLAFDYPDKGRSQDEIAFVVELSRGCRIPVFREGSFLDFVDGGV
jgi:hypothetical protein